LRDFESPNRVVGTNLNTNKINSNINLNTYTNNKNQIKKEIKGIKVFEIKMVKNKTPIQRKLYEATMQDVILFI
jgi:hypothetical protein